MPAADAALAHEPLAGGLAATLLPESAEEGVRGPLRDARG